MEEDSSSFEKLPLAGNVADVMQWGIIHCFPETPLREVASLMSHERVHCVVVTEDPVDADAVWGVVSDLDLVAAATVRSLDEQRAGGTAMAPAITVSPDESLAIAALRMTRNGVSHLVVIDEMGRRPLGVVSTLDLARSLAGIETQAATPFSSSAPRPGIARSAPTSCGPCG